MKKDDVERIVESEFAYFASEEILAAFRSVRIEPYSVTGTWQYGAPREHECWVVADDAHGKEQVVYCPSGFGPTFPWGRLLKGKSDMGMDDVWYAYLYEAFAASALWTGKTPDGFELKGPGERKRQ